MIIWIHCTVTCIHNDVMNMDFGISSSDDDDDDDDDDDLVLMCIRYQDSIYHLVMKNNKRGILCVEIVAYFDLPAGKCSE